MPIEINKLYVFTAGVFNSSVDKEHHGRIVKVIRELTEEEYDDIENARIYKVQLPEGAIFEAFEEELIEYIGG